MGAPISKVNDADGRLPFKPWQARDNWAEREIQLSLLILQVKIWKN